MAKLHKKQILQELYRIDKELGFANPRLVTLIMHLEEAIYSGKVPEEVKPKPKPKPRSAPVRDLTDYHFTLHADAALPPITFPKLGLAGPPDVSEFFEGTDE